MTKYAEAASGIFLVLEALTMEAIKDVDRPVLIEKTKDAIYAVSVEMIKLIGTLALLDTYGKKAEQDD